MPAPDQGIQSSLSRQRYLSLPRTLVFVTRGAQVLLLRGAPDKPIWPGKWNGVGGHVERDENVRDGARREIIEETGLKVEEPRLCAVIHIDGAHPTCGIMLFVFTAESPEGPAVESKEGALRWFPFSSIPTDDLVEDLPILLPKVLGRRPDQAPLFARYRYIEGKLQIEFS